MKASAADRLAALSSEQRVRLLRRLVEAGALEEIPDVVPMREGNGPIRLSPAQQDLWVYESLYPETGALNLCCAYHFARPVDPSDLEAALTILHEHHDILRMRILGPPDDLRVAFPPARPFTLDKIDLRHGSVTVAQVIDAFSRRTFALDRDGLVRGQFITVDDTHATLVLNLHHMVSDWWSFDILHTEFREAYRAVQDGCAHRLRRPEIQYADFACWQRELEAAGVLDAQLSFWRGYLAGLPPPLRVGGAAACAPGTEFGIQRIPFSTGTGSGAAIRAFAREHGTTVYSVLMTAFAVFAHRLSGRPDLIIGTPVANRSAKGLQRVVGYVMNTVPTRWGIGPTDRFADLLGRFRTDFPTVLANTDVPVGRMIAALGPERMPGRSPLFQWVFMYLPSQPSSHALREIAEPERIHTGGEYDVVGIMQDTDDGIAGRLEIRTDVYPADVVRRWADCFSVLLAGLLAEPDLPVAAIPLLSGVEQQRLLHSVDDPAASLPAASIADLATRWAGQTPDAVAVESGGITLSYAQLTAHANRLALGMRRRGLRPGEIVALALRRSPAMVVALLAVQRTGAAYLPVDPDYPAERIRFMLDDAAPALLVTDAETTGELPDAGVPQLVLDLGSLSFSAQLGEPQAATSTDSQQAGYVTYTSGSAGRPKGVVVTHEGIGGLAAALVRRLGLDTTSRILQLGSPSFDIFAGELCLAFGSGGTLVMPATGSLAGDALAAVLVEHQITCLLLPPTVLASVPHGEYPQLRGLCVGGEACPPELVDSWSASGRRIINAYGPTEATVAVTLSEPLPVGAGAPPIGRPIPGMRAYVLDERLRPAPVGVPGELYVAGAGLARGYLGRPGLTAERFLADPHAPRPGSRMYRTGDMARWREDGQLDFLFRADEQVNMHGFRIEPTEIEAVLARHESVAQAAVLLREDAPGEQRLVAYLVPRRGADLSQETLLEHAMAALPVHMLPSAFIELGMMPTTPHGKLDRAALPPPASGSRPEWKAPSTSREETLCGLFAEVLDVPTVGVLDDFFSLGGDSIKVIQLVRLAHAAGLELLPREIFITSTPAGLAAVSRTAADLQARQRPGPHPAEC